MVIPSKKKRVKKFILGILFLFSFLIVKPVFATDAGAVDFPSAVYLDVAITPSCGAGVTDWRVRNNESTIVAVGVCGSSFIYPTVGFPAYGRENSYIRNLAGGPVTYFTPDVYVAPAVGPTYAGGFSSSATGGVITSTLANYGLGLLAILGAFLGIGVAYLVFRFGWHNLKHMATGLNKDKGESWLDLPKRGEKYLD